MRIVKDTHTDNFENVGQFMPCLFFLQKCSKIGIFSKNKTFCQAYLQVLGVMFSNLNLFHKNLRRKKVEQFLNFVGKPNLFESVLFHREMFGLSYFGIVLGYYHKQIWCTLVH